MHYTIDIEIQDIEAIAHLQTNPSEIEAVLYDERLKKGILKLLNKIHPDLEIPEKQEISIFISVSE